MEQDTTTFEYQQVDPSSKAESSLKDPIPAPRERSGSDSPKFGLESKIDSFDHSSYMSPRLKSILLWENPKVSAAHLGGSLAIVLLCRWVSLLNLTCGLLVFGISGSFLYVNGLILLSRVTSKPTVRPLEKYYQHSSKFVNVEADTLHRRVSYATDGLNVILTELAKVVLIEDNKRSLKFIGIFYVIWTLRTWFSTTTLLSIILISLFAAPRLYLDNQSLIDGHVAKTNDLVQGHLNTAYSKVEQFAQEKGLVKKADIKSE
ncbi:reticulon-like protein of the endoplasmic reticulum [Mortierella sp. AD094]|nr:reticulon-like protein of the endoplasmic reticulum [Mortierella sp. AD094]